MAEKRVSVRLVAEGGRQVRAELEGIGEAGTRGFGRLGRGRRWRLRSKPSMAPRPPRAIGLCRLPALRSAPSSR
jgi:hypothetical protein